MTKNEQKLLIKFCKEVLKSVKGNKQSSWFSPLVGLCYNWDVYTNGELDSKQLKSLMRWKSDYPWGNYHATQEDLYKNPKRIAFLKRWANKN